MRTSDAKRLSFAGVWWQDDTSRRSSGVRVKAWHGMVWYGMVWYTNGSGTKVLKNCVTIPTD